jgi:hypothetical protein
VTSEPSRSDISSFELLRFFPEDSNMADSSFATPASVAITTSEEAIPGQKVKPEKPDEAQFKKDLAEAEKSHAESMTKMVSLGVY